MGSTTTKSFSSLQNPIEVESPLENRNFLPRDGEAVYEAGFLNDDEATKFFAQLIGEVKWANDTGVLFGKPYVTGRKVAWYGDEPWNYGYSGEEKLALPWIEPLLRMKKRVEAVVGEKFNSCLLNLYHDGSEAMGWHSDDERVLREGAAIASVSLGAERKFAFRHKETREKVDLMLGNGSLLVMRGETQKCWHHCIRKSVRVMEPRVNLTFRRMAAA